MEKNILKRFAFIYLILLLSCSQRDASEIEAIKDLFWDNKSAFAKKDSLLIIGEYKKTKKYKFYWANTHTRPFKTDSLTALCFQMVDKRTIYRTKCDNVYHDTKRLIAADMIRLSKSTAIDDRLKGGYMFIVNQGNQRSVVIRQISLISFFDRLELVESKLNLEQINIDSTWDDVAKFFW